jgi:hypothetical protein
MTTQPESVVIDIQGEVENSKWKCYIQMQVRTKFFNRLTIAYIICNI